jgi:hypothetical protein
MVQVSKLTKQHIHQSYTGGAVNVPVEESNVSSVGSAISHATAGVMNNVNQVLQSPEIQQAAQKTAAIVSKTAQNINQTMNNPILRAQVNEAIDHGGEIASRVVEASKQPMKKFMNVVINSAMASSGDLGSGAAKVAADVVGAIPGIGAVVDGLRILNDSSKALSSVAKTASTIAESASETVEETKQIFDQQYKDALNTGQAITNRTNNSMKAFLDPSSKLKGLQQGMQNSVQGLQQGMQNSVQGVQKGMQNKVQGVQQGMQNKVQGVQKGMQNTVQGLKHDLGKGIQENIGRSIGNGLQQAFVQSFMGGKRRQATKRKRRRAKRRYSIKRRSLHLR